ISVMYLPIVFLAGAEVLAHGRRGWIVALGTAMVLQILSSAYLAVLTFTLAAAVLVGWRIATGRLDREPLARFVAVVAVAAVAALAVYAPGIALGSLPRPPRTIQETLSAAPLASYVPGIGRPIGNAGRFVGFPAALLAVAGLVAPAPTARAARLRVLAVAVGAAGWVLSLGPTLHLPADVALPLPF